MQILLHLNEESDPIYFFLPGLAVDGIYRVSGNLAVIQKLRFKADHGNII